MFYITLGIIYGRDFNMPINWRFFIGIKFTGKKNRKFIRRPRAWFLMVYVVAEQFICLTFTHRLLIEVYRSKYIRLKGYWHIKKDGTWQFHLSNCIICLSLETS